MNDVPLNSLEEEREKRNTAKISVSMPSPLLNFMDQQCQAFRCGRSLYIQMLLEAESRSPRKAFVKLAGTQSADFE